MNGKPRWFRMREAGAASSAGTLERAAGASTTTPNGTSGDDDADDTPCTTCEGTGIDDGGICGTCQGSGSTLREASSSMVNCPTCAGDGKIRGGQMKCPDCNGAGKVPSTSPLLKESEVAIDFRDLGRLANVSAAWTDDGALREASVGRLSEKDYATATRIDFAKQGKAIPIKNEKGLVTGGAYPINDGGDLEDAVKAFGRHPTPETKAHIVKNAKRLGMTSKLPADWTGSTKEAGSLEERITALEATLAQTNGLRESKPDHLNSTFAPMTRVKNSHGQEGYEVTLIREGKGNEADDNWYTGDAIRDLCESGRAEGMQAYANHPDMEEEENRPERDVRHLIGTHTDVRVAESVGKATAKAVFIPITTDESHPTYGWVTTLAEAATRNQGPQPLVGWSLYGLSAGDDGKRPDGSEGRIVNLIMPSSGDMVTNAGAGGEFARKLMMESARRLRRATTPNEGEPMQIGTFRTQMAEALKKVREADSDEARTAAMQEVQKLEGEAAKIDVPVVPNSIEALTESAPALVTQLREAAKVEAATEKADLEKQLREAQSKLGEAEKFIGGISEVQDITKVLREAKVEDPTELRYFTAKARERGLREAVDIIDMVETERRYQQEKDDRLLEKIREAVGDGPEIEGVLGRTPKDSGDSGVSWLREAGVPIKEPATA